MPARPSEVNILVLKMICKLWLPLIMLLSVLTARADGKSDFDLACAACHGFGVAGAPKLGDRADWAGRIDQGVARLYDHAINGYVGESGVMPAKGGFTHLSDAQVKAIVDYMLTAVE